jgi:hypothetical protein
MNKYGRVEANFHIAAPVEVNDQLHAPDASSSGSRGYVSMDVVVCENFVPLKGMEPRHPSRSQSH